METLTRKNVQKVLTTEISCTGEQAPSGHPKIFIHLPATGKVVSCPYCGQQFVLKKKT